MSKNLENSIKGCLIGAAVGDSVGLPFEGLSFKTIQKKRFNLNKHNFLFGYGMVSDDTEHLYITAISLINSKGDINLFEKYLAKYLKIWLLSLPAGIGLATLRAILKLIMGFPVGKNGVFSAGNGPAMRASVLGVCFGENEQLLSEYIKISTRITHTDKKAEIGAMAVAVAAYLSSKESNVTFELFNEKLVRLVTYDSDFSNLLNKLDTSLKSNQTTQEFAESLGLKKGVTGYMYHTVPVVLHCWLTNQNDFDKAIKNIISLGGDTDTTAAILGGIMGARETNIIPQEWKSKILEPNLNIRELEETALLLSDCQANNSYDYKTKNYPFLTNFLRNVLFTIIVLAHGFKRFSYIF